MAFSIHEGIQSAQSAWAKNKTSNPIIRAIKSGIYFVVGFFRGYKVTPYFPKEKVVRRASGNSYPDLSANNNKMRKVNPVRVEASKTLPSPGSEITDDGKFSDASTLSSTVNKNKSQSIQSLDESIIEMNRLCDVIQDHIDTKKTARDSIRKEFRDSFDLTKRSSLSKDLKEKTALLKDLDFLYTRLKNHQSVAEYVSKYLLIRKQNNRYDINHQNSGISVINLKVNRLEKNISEIPSDANTLEKNLKENNLPINTLYIELAIAGNEISKKMLSAIKADLKK